MDLYHEFELNPDDPDTRAQYYVENGHEDVGVHPNSEGHRIMYPLWKPFVEDLLSDSGADSADSRRRRRRCGWRNR